MKPYGDAGKIYIDWAAKMADSLDVGNPWIMCQQEDAPPPMVNSLFLSLYIYCTN